MNVNTIVSRICNDECTTCPHRGECARKDWNTPAFEVSYAQKHGKDAECPLMQFNAKKAIINKLDRINIRDTWAVCHKCKYATTGVGVTSITDAFQDHCIDCACELLREVLEETEAEARNS